MNASGDPRCGVTEEIPPLTGDGPVWVYVCGREPGHGGQFHFGRLLHPGPGEEHATATWPRESARKDPGGRYARLAEARGPYRVGRKCPWNVYRQIGDDPSDEDVALFDASRPDIAALVVDALNGHANGHPVTDQEWNRLFKTLARSVNELGRLTEALRTCEAALHHTAVIRADIDDEDAKDLLHAAQQASGAYTNEDWHPARQTLDNAGRCAPAPPAGGES